MASNCCDKQDDDDAGRAEVAWSRKLIDEIGRHMEESWLKFGFIGVQ